MKLVDNHFEVEKIREIKKINQQNAFLNFLQQEGRKIGIVNSDQHSKIEHILLLNNKYLKKLEASEFEIAVVGLEKAGKSTFANALIENSVLPSAPERCTFTSTRLVYGHDDKAIVEFYTKKEFNHIFRSLLKEINYPKAESESYETMSSQDFDLYFSQLSEINNNLFQLHSGKTDEEIRDILKYRNKLILDEPVKEFAGEDLLSEEFQSYIKGHKIGDDTDTSKPRSVKRVEIQSSKLKKLTTAIVYDVPGFDSPTKIHERQTIERLKSADAIILVTNAGDRPNITAPQLDTIRKHNDGDGIALKDKLFVFGNKIDTANSFEDAKNNERQLRNDIVNKYKIGEDKRLFVGSAKKYLSNKGLDSGGTFKNSFDIEDKVDDIRAELIRYYENERFELLKNKIHKDRCEIKEIFTQILEAERDSFDENFADNERNRVIRSAYKEIEFRLKKSLEELKFDLKNEVWGEKYFSNKFKEDIANSSYFREISDEMIKRAKLTEDESLTRDIPVDKINHAIRKQLHGDFLQQFSTLINQMTDIKARDLEMKILNNFTSGVLGNEAKHLIDYINEESKSFIKRVTKNVFHNDGRFVYLLERFSRDLFDILILHPLHSNDRADKFKSAELEFTHLDYYYSGGKKKLVDIILLGEKRSDVKEDLFLNKLAELNVLVNNSDLFNSNAEEVKNKTNDLYSSYLKEKESNYHIEEYVKPELACTTESDVLKEINNDILNLREVLRQAVIPAINLELVFYNSIDKQIKLLLDSLKNSSAENNIEFDKYISRVATRVKERDLAAISEKAENNKMKLRFIEELKVLEL